jgi:hypothetical protein
MLVVIAVVLAGCSSIEVGRQFDLSAFDTKVMRGVTTQSDVRAWLGAPSSVGISIETNGDRYEQWTYYHGAGHLTNMADSTLTLLRIKFDQGGVVRAYEWSGGQK